MPDDNPTTSTHTDTMGTAAAVSTAAPTRPAAPSRTCDNCRKRKIKCVQHGEDALGGVVDQASYLSLPCDGCSKLGLPCTYDYVRKKPGRKNSFALAVLAQQNPAGMPYHHAPLGARGPSHLSRSTGQGHGSGSAHGHAGLGGPSASAHDLDPSSLLNDPNFFPYSPISSIDPSHMGSSARGSSQAQAGARSNGHANGNGGGYSRMDMDSLREASFYPDFRDSGANSAGAVGGTATGAPERPSAAPSSSFGGGGGGINRGFSSFAFSPAGLKADPSLLWLDNMLDPTGNGMGGQAFGLPLDPGVGGLFPTDQAQLLSLESPEHPGGLGMLPPLPSGGMALGGGGGAGKGGADTSNLSGVGFGTGSASGGPGGLGGVPNLNDYMSVRREPQLEDVTTWANISHFISLFLQYLYPLLPLVHRPTFAEHLAMRLDKQDTDFRALLLSIVAYVISQLPTSRLVNDQFDIEGLKRLQRRCHRTGKALQRTYYGPTNLTQITTIVFDTFYLLTIGLGHTAGARLGQAVNLAYSMGMHSDERTDAQGLDAIEVQLRRRVFWQMYASDKTRAIPGLPMLLNDFQGLPSLPEPVDDEFITSQGSFPQPPARTSVLAGFVSLSRIFKIVSECFFHYRCAMTPDAALALPRVGIEWTLGAEDRLHAVLRELPAVIQDPMVHPNEAARQVFAMQRANVLITAAIAKFALYDLRAALHVDEDQLARERETNAREIHSLLMNIPVEDLASNGESVRAKVFHIACALCSGIGANETDQDLIKDWCNMFSAISFVQMPLPAPGAPGLESRSTSPPAGAGQPHSVPSAQSMPSVGPYTGTGEPGSVGTQAGIGSV